MTTLVILTDESPMNLPVTLEEHLDRSSDEVIYACIGIEDRHGDKYQHIRDHFKNVVFTGGMEPLYYFAKHNIYPKVVIDSRILGIYVDEYSGIDHIPD